MVSVAAGVGFDTAVRPAGIYQSPSADRLRNRLSQYPTRSYCVCTAPLTQYLAGDWRLHRGLSLGKDLSTLPKSICPFIIARSDFVNVGGGATNAGAARTESWDQVFCLKFGQLLSDNSTVIAKDDQSKNEPPRDLAFSAHSEYRRIQ